MKKMCGRIFLGLAGVFVILQLVPVDRSNPPVVADFEAPLEVKSILKRSCYDCHSNEVNWPWYGYVAPVSWLVAHDVKEGRAELNFSEWNRYAGDAEMREEIVEEVAEGEMPLAIYTAIHRDAVIGVAELATLKRWAGFAGSAGAPGREGHEGGHDDDD